jgi:hypothetical protein
LQVLVEELVAPVEALTRAGASGSSSGAPANSTANPTGTIGSGTNPAVMGNPNATSDSNANDPNRQMKEIKIARPVAAETPFGWSRD